MTLQTLRNKLNNKQKEVFDRWVDIDPVWLVNHGAVRSGKSYIDHIIWMLHVSRFANKKLNFIMTGYTLSSLKKNVLDDLTDIFGVDTRLDSNNTFELFGNKMRCFGTNDCDAYKSIKGFTAYGLYANEINLSHKSAIEEAIKRCSGDGARMIADCNPDSPNHWVKTDIIDKSGLRLSDGSILYDSNHFTLHDNSKKNGGTLSDAYIESLERTLSGVSYDRDVKGLWVAREGIVYDCFIESQMIVEHPAYCSEYFAGVDWGFEHYGVIVLLGVDREKIVVMDIIKEKHKDIDWWKARQDEIKAKYKCYEWYCDSARPEYVKKFGGIDSDKSVIEGIDKVYSMLYNNQLLVSRKCSQLFTDEVYKYRWKTGLKEEPVKENDDIMDAIRYAIFNKYGKRIRNPYLEMMRGKK